MRYRYSLVLGASVALIGSPASAQLLLAPADRAASEDSSSPTHGARSRNRLLAHVGIEPELVSWLGYAHSRLSNDARTELGLGANMKLAPVTIETAAFRLNLLAFARKLTPARWGVMAALLPYLVHENNEAGQFWGTGAELRVHPGYFERNWTLALDLGWQATVLTHIEHSAMVRQTFQQRYPDEAARESEPRDGWYAFTAHRFRVGLGGAYASSSRFALSAGLGSLFSPQKQGAILLFSVGQVPLYAELGMQYTLP